MKGRFVPIVALLAFGLLTAGPARAQDAPAIQATPRADEVTRQRVTMRLETLAAKLELTADQKSKLRPILEAEATDLRALRMDTSLTPEDQQGRFEAIRRSSREQIDALLTPEQQKKLEEIRAKSREKAQEAQGQKRKGRVPVVDDEE
jgi:Spy/CpxP family protein refolding chaperone